MNCHGSSGYQWLLKHTFTGTALNYVLKIQVVLSFYGQLVLSALPWRWLLTCDYALVRLVYYVYVQYEATRNVRGCFFNILPSKYYQNPMVYNWYHRTWECMLELFLCFDIRVLYNGIKGMYALDLTMLCGCLLQILRSLAIQALPWHYVVQLVSPNQGNVCLRTYYAFPSK